MKLRAADFARLAGRPKSATSGKFRITRRFKDAQRHTGAGKALPGAVPKNIGINIGFLLIFTRYFT
jgi:hypothetical protein